jgi:pimeloyl-ACP methyl ester carboxylesterase
MAPGTEATTEVIAVEVPGGHLAAEYLTAGSGSARPVLAIHGISSQRKLWNWLRAELPGLSLIAPDLRGRGGSVGVEGSSSVARHATDILFGPSSWEQIRQPVGWLTAEWSTGRDTPPAYPPEAIAHFQNELKTLTTVVPVPGVDHAASIMSPAGARATAELLSEALR